MKPSKKDFIAEAEEIIEYVNGAVLELKDEFNPDTLNSVFRSIHTMKGLAGLFGIEAITEFSHALESLLDDLRLDRINLTDETVDFILNNIDILKSLIFQVSEDAEISDVSSAIKDIEVFRERARAETKEVSISDIGVDQSIIKVLSEYEEQRLKSNFKEGKGIYLIRTVLKLEDYASTLEVLNTDLKSFGEIIAILPSSEGVPEGSLGFTLLFGTSSTIDDIKSKVSSADIREIVPPKVVPSKAVPDLSRPREDSYKSTTGIIRVDIEKLDNILNTVSDLVMAKGAVARIGQEMAETVGYIPLTIDVHKVAQTLDRKLKELQSHILELRMVPFSQIFIKLAQIVRRHTRKVGKKIDLKLFGEDTEIDKQIAEEIMESLIHLVRNAIDHGIETNEERLALGKNEHGSVMLRAFSKGNSVVVEVRDDGRGLDTDKILRKAIEKKLISEGQSLERKEIINLIFKPGFSTKEDVSEISGRGVGMDIVKEKITSLGGFVGVETENGVGTTFTLTLPITLAIIRALIIRTGDKLFAIPLTSIIETFIIEREKIQTIEGREVVKLRKEMLPLLRVSRVFMLEEKLQDEYYGVVVGVGERRLGLLVDALLEQTEIVIKPLGQHLKDIPCLSGAAEIGRHEVVLVIDVDAMMEEAFSGLRAVKKGS